MDGGSGEDQIYLSSASTGVTEIAYDSDDSITLVLESDYTGDGIVTFEQDGDDVQVLLDGVVVAVLTDADADDIDNVVSIASS